MAKLKTNMILTFASLVLATLALFASPTSFDEFLPVENAYLSTKTEYIDPSANTLDQQSDIAYFDSNGPLQSALFLGNRRPLSHISLRLQRGGSLYRIIGRDGSLFRDSSAFAVKSISAASLKHVGFPTPLSYHVPKDYYVFTLKRILC